MGQQMQQIMKNFSAGFHGFPIWACNAIPVTGEGKIEMAGLSIH